MNVELIIRQTKHWVESVVVECHFCPFAKRELEQDRVRFIVSGDRRLEDCLEQVFDECVYLDQHENIETTLLIFPETFTEFNDYLVAVEVVERMLLEQGYQGIYQLASFHPEYCFADALSNDPANYTNRSPYPMFHLLREASLEKALENYPDPESIPIRNVRYAREKGLEVMQEKIERCRRHE